MAPTATQIKRSRIGLLTSGGANLATYGNVQTVYACSGCASVVQACPRCRPRRGGKRRTVSTSLGGALDGLSSPRWAEQTGSERLVLELRAAERGLVHQPALDDREGGHALLIAGTGLGRRVMLSAARTRGRTGRTRAGGRSRRDGDRAGLGPELEVARGELVERALILEEDEQAVTLCARLPAEAHLVHLGRADLLALPIDAPRPVGSTDSEAGLADRREDR